MFSAGKMKSFSLKDYPMEIGEEKIDNQEMESSSYAEEEVSPVLPESNPPLSIWQLILLFLGGVVVCTIFFAMGFLIGKNQGKMEQMIASGSRGPGVQDVAAQNSPTSSLPRSVAAAGTPTQSNLEFFNEVNKNTRSEPAPQAGITPKEPSGQSKLAELPSSATGTVEASKTPASASELRSDAPVITATEGETPKPKESKEVYRIQMGAFQTQDEAQNLVLELEAKRFEAFIEPPSGRTDPYYRVQMGPYSSNAKVTEMVGRLKKAGFNAYKKKY